MLREAVIMVAISFQEQFLGKVEITQVSDIHPSEMIGEKLTAWAWRDGFEGFHKIDPFGDEHKVYADEWFTARYGDDWMQRTWTVIRWRDWKEVYFLPENGDNQQ